MGTWICNGRLRDDEPALPARDAGVLRGDGVFEVMDVRGGRPFALDAHLERLGRSAARLRLDVDLDVVRADLALLCKASGEERHCIRFFVTHGGHRIGLPEPAPSWPDVLHVQPVAHRISPLVVGIKSLSYAPHMLARREAVSHGADEALLYDADTGVVLEGPTSAFCWVADGELFVPPLELGILDSITRRVLCTVCDVQERELRVDRLGSVEAAALLGTGVDLVPIGHVGGVGPLDARDATIQVAAARVREAIDAHLPISLDEPAERLPR